MTLGTTSLTVGVDGGGDGRFTGVEARAGTARGVGARCGDLGALGCLVGVRGPTGSGSGTRLSCRRFLVRVWPWSVSSSYDLMFTCL